jgi:adenine/guanine phosphoribosyltransferase-like PRPP-binding protein
MNRFRSVPSKKQAEISPSPVELPAPFPVAVAGRARGQLANALDGRYGPLDSAVLRETVLRLIERVDLTGVNYVMGIPEGGTIPAYAFSASAGLPVVLASALQPDLPGLIRFSMDHAPPTSAAKYIYGLAPGDHVIVVDDEVTTGRSIINCVRALRAASVRCDQIVSIYASDDRDMHSRLAAEGIRLYAACLFPKSIGDKLYAAP